MSNRARAIRLYSEFHLERLLKPQVSLYRQVLSGLLSVVVLFASFLALGHVPYWLEHLLAYFFCTLVGYAISGSWRIAWPFLTVWSLYNELVVDLAKVNHPHIDWDQIAADFAGIMLASCFLRFMGLWLPGRSWQRKTLDQCIGTE